MVYYQNKKFFTYLYCNANFPALSISMFEVKKKNSLSLSNSPRTAYLNVDLERETS